MAKKPRTGTCVYCGTVGPVTSDHVPPKCLFPPDTRVNLITVDACEPCHDSFKLDDEYFRVTLSIRDDLPDGPASEFLREQTKRTLRKPEAAGFRAAIRVASRLVERRTPSGIYLGRSMALYVDGTRVASTARRLVRGLYSKFYGEILPQHCDVVVESLDLPSNQSAIRTEEVQELLAQTGRTGNRKQFSQVLDVWYAKAGDDPHATFWVVQLHGAFGFFAFTLPCEDAT
jgi:hypothetical protein